MEQHPENLLAASVAIGVSPSLGRGRLLPAGTHVKSVESEGMGRTVSSSASSSNEDMRRGNVSLVGDGRRGLREGKVTHRR